MTGDDRSQASLLTGRVEEPTLVELIERLAHFEGPPEAFLVALLATQCHLARGQGGAILRPSGNQEAHLVAIYPPLTDGATPPVWLAQAGESAGQVLATGQTALRPIRGPADLYGAPSDQHVIMIPLRGGGEVRGLAVFYVQGRDPNELAAARQRLELTVSLISLYEMRLTLQRRQSDLRRLRLTLETLATLNEQDRLAATAMTMCNETAARWKADRVGLGLLAGRYVKLKALSHTEKFSRKQKLIQDLESAMEECLDQNVEIVHPAPENATFVCRATNELCKRHGPMALVSLPLRRDGEPMAVLTLQRPIDQPFELEEIEALRLACDLCAPRLAILQKHDRWFGAKAAGGLRRGLSVLVGAKHTWAKLIAILVLGGLLFISLAKGRYQAEAPFVLEAQERRVIAAPFGGALHEVPDDIAPGQPVTRGKLLATLKTSELKLEHAKALARRAFHEAELDKAKAKPDPAEEAVAKALVGEVQAEIDLLEQKLRDARIESPIDGRIVSGDWTKTPNKPVQLGEPLFEIVPAGVVWAELSVPEDQIAEVREGNEGELAAASYPSRRIRFVVERINPVAEVVNQQNVFKVRVRLLEQADWLRPGMEGVAKVHLGRKVYAWLWSRRLVNWVRMKLWL